MRTQLAWLGVVVVAAVGWSLAACEPSCEELLTCEPYAGSSGGAGGESAGGGGEGGQGGKLEGCGDGIAAPGEICLNGPITTFNVPGTDYISDVELADCDGDNDLDVLILGASDPLGNSSVIAAHINSGDGAYANAVITDIPGGAKPDDLLIGDFDGLGRADVAMPFSPMVNQSLQVHVGAGDCTFVFDNEIVLPGFAQSVAIGFFDGDGAEDLVVTTNFPPELRTFFSQSASQVLATGQLAQTVVAGTFDEGLTTDIAYVSGDNIVFRPGTGTSFGAVSTSPVSGGAGSLPAQLADADMNGDSVLDLVLVHSDSNSVSVMQNSGTGTFSLVDEEPTQGTGARHIDVADVDNDGDIDVLVSNSDDDRLTLLLNDGAGNLSPPSAAPGLEFPSPLTVDGFHRGARLADVNGDGAVDIVFAYQPTASAGNLYVLLANP